MTTEVQIRKNRLYLPYLRKVVSAIAARLGMNSADIEVTEDVVSEICQTAIDAEADSNGNLLIKLDINGSCMTVEINDPSMQYDPIVFEKLFGRFHIIRETAGRNTPAEEDIEYLRADEGIIIRLRRYVVNRNSLMSSRLHHLSQSVSRTASLQS